MTHTTLLSHHELGPNEDGQLDGFGERQAGRKKSIGTIWYIG